jgi:hypothetical protein
MPVQPNTSPDNSTNTRTKPIITFSGTNFSVNYRVKLAPLLGKGKLLLFISFAKTFEKNALLRWGRGDEDRGPRSA